MGKTEQKKHVRGRLVAGLVLAAALLLVLAIAAPYAGAFPTFTQGQNPVSACTTCHSSSAHDVPEHPTTCTTCHVNGTSPYTPPVPSACASCHGGASGIIGQTSHANAGCGTTAGCHGAQAAAPVVTAFTPASGLVGATVTLTGTGFTGATGVTFNGTAAVTFTVVSATKITAKVPVGATNGTIAVTTPAGTGTSTGSFSVLTKSTVTIQLTGLKAGAMKVNKTVTIKGVVSPARTGKATVTIQRKVGTKWVNARVIARTINATSGAYSYPYKATKKGSYHVKVTTAKDATFAAGASAQKNFKVT